MNLGTNSKSNLNTEMEKISGKNLVIDINTIQIQKSVRRDVKSLNLYQNEYEKPLFSNTNFFSGKYQMIVKKICHKNIVSNHRICIDSKHFEKFITLIQSKINCKESIFQIRAI